MKPDFNLIKEWYWNSSVKFEMIKFSFNREFSLLQPSYLGETNKNTRYLRMHNVQSFDFFNTYFEVFKNNILFNYYYSLAKYKKGLPNRTFRKFDIEPIGLWRNNHYKHIEEFDFLIDIDAGEHSDIDYARESTQIIIDLFNELNVPYELRFSGMGFHIVIPYKFLPQDLSFNPKDKNNLYKLLSSISKTLEKKYSEMIDTHIYDSRRLIKIPYSLALYESSMYVCTPILDKQEFNTFRLEHYEIDYMFTDVQQRGNNLFNKDGNINKLLEKLKIKI